jgi:hypothetical protein
MRKQALIGALAVAALGGAAHAQNQTHYHCTQTGGAFSTCQDSEGGMYTVYKDPFGATITDNQGQTSRVTHDAFGGTTIQRSDGETIHGHTDMFGNTTYDDGQGHQAHCRRSPISLPGETDEDCQ